MEIKNQKGRITLYPTRIIIDGYDERIAQLEGPLNVWNNVTFSYDFQAFIKDEEKKRIYLPNAYTLYTLKKYFPNYKIEDKRPEINSCLNEYYKNIKPIALRYDFKDDLQRESVKFLKTLNGKNMEKYLCLKTGQGKTYCAIRYIAETNDRPIIFVDQDSLAEQWKERILEYTDTEEDEIYYISGQNSINRLYKRGKDEMKNIKFFLCCYRTFSNKLKSSETSKEISDLINFIQVNLKIHDEAHVEYMTIFKLNMICNLKTIYLSATPQRSDPNEDKVYQNMLFLTDKFSSANMKRKNNKDNKDEDENYHNIIIYNWNSKPNLKNQSECQTKYGFSMARYFKYLEEEKYEQFEELLYDLIFNQILKNRRKKKIAILFGTNSIIDKFYNNLCQYVIDMNYKLKIGKFNGTIKKSERLKELTESDIIITTDKSFSKGLESENLQVLINTVPFSSETKLTQVIGRLRKLPNKEVFFFDINDNGFEPILYQLKNKRDKVFRVIGKKVFNKKYKM